MPTQKAPSEKMGLFLNHMVKSGSRFWNPLFSVAMELKLEELDIQMPGALSVSIWACTALPARSKPSRKLLDRVWRGNP